MGAIIFVKAREKEKKQVQINACKEYARNNDIKIIGVSDDMGKLLNSAIHNDVKKIIITERSRLTRNTKEYYNYLIMFKKIGIELVILNKQ